VMGFSFFRDVDANNDGMISRSELNVFLRSYGFDSHCFEIAFENATSSEFESDDKGD
jgi:Ca2+-binding EF-hand superfamily protein